MEKSGEREYEPLGVKGLPKLDPVERLFCTGKLEGLCPNFFSQNGDTTIQHPPNNDFTADIPLGRFMDGCYIPNVNRAQFTFNVAKSGISSTTAAANKKTDCSGKDGLPPGRFFSGIFFPYAERDGRYIPFGQPPEVEEIQTTNDLGSHKIENVESSPKLPKHVDRSAAAAANKEASGNREVFKRFHTADNDLELDKCENVESDPKRLKHVGSSAAENKKPGGNGEDFYDKSSNQATHGDSDQYNCAIFVDNNLGDINFTDEHLRKILVPFGKFLYCLIMKETQCGFAMFLTRRSAEEAVRNLNGTDLAGQKLRVSFASDKIIKEAINSTWDISGLLRDDPPVSDRVPPPSPWCWLETVETGGSFDQSSNQATQSDIGPKEASYKSIQASHGGMDPKIPNNTSILVDNLVPNVTEEQLRQFFTPCGEVNYVKIMAGTKFGFVQFVNRSCAEEAMRNMNGKELAGQNLKLSFSNKKERGEEYKNNGLPYGWSGSGIFRGVPPLCSDSGLPTSGGWFSAPSPFMLDKVINPADPRMGPTKQDVQTDDAIMDFYKRWCSLNNVDRTPEEMRQRFRFFKKEAISVYELNRNTPGTSFGLMRWADDPSNEPRGGIAE